MVTLAQEDEMKIIPVLLFASTMATVAVANTDGNGTKLVTAPSPWCLSMEAVLGPKTGTFTFDNEGDISGLTGLGSCSAAKLAAKALASFGDVSLAYVDGSASYQVTIN
jgi:hypothetical protein